MEAQFDTRSITVEHTKFDYVVTLLSTEVATEVCNLILSPPDTDPYKVLKEQLISWTAASEQRRLQQLFNTEELGDRTGCTSYLVRRLQQLIACSCLSCF